MLLSGCSPVRIPEVVERSRTSKSSSGQLLACHVAHSAQRMDENQTPALPRVFEDLIPIPSSVTRSSLTQKRRTALVKQQTPEIAVTWAKTWSWAMLGGDLWKRFTHATTSRAVHFRQTSAGRKATRRAFRQVLRPRCRSGGVAIPRKAPERGVDNAQRPQNWSDSQPEDKCPTPSRAGAGVGGSANRTSGSSPVAWRGQREDLGQSTWHPSAARPSHSP